MKQMLVALLLVSSIPVVPWAIGCGIAGVCGVSPTWAGCWIFGFLAGSCGLLVSYAGYVAWLVAGDILEK